MSIVQQNRTAYRTVSMAAILILTELILADLIEY